MTETEVDIAERNVRHDIAGIKSLLKKLLAVVFVALAIMSAAGIVTVRTAEDTKAVSQQNRAFLQNFSDYMRCLILNDDAVVKSYGKENYFNLCDDLLFRNTGLVPSHTVVTIPSTTTTTTKPIEVVK